MLQTSAPLITRYDYQAMREGPPYCQVIEGDLVMSPSPTTYHQRIIGRIFSIIHVFLQKHPVGEVFLAPLDVYLTETNVYQPDIVFLSNEHRSMITDQGIEGSPDWVIEILSPGTSAYDRGSKRKIYAKTGVHEMWLVHPETKQIQVFRLQDNPEIPLATHGETSVFSSKLLPGLKFRAATIFK